MSAILLHLSKEILTQWDVNLNDTTFTSAKIYSSITHFLKRLEKFNFKIFYSFEVENNFTKKIHPPIKALKNITQVTYQHELEIIQDLVSQNHKNILYFNNFFLLFDETITKTLLDTHSQYNADYSYAENLPLGICPVMFSSFLIEAFQANLDDDTKKIPAMPVPLNEYIEKNINKFHVEIHYEDIDLRMYRMDFSSANMRSFIKTFSFYQEIENFENLYPEIASLIDKKPELLFLHPTYIELEIYSDCDMKCSFCPRQSTSIEARQITLEQINTITDIIKSKYQDTSIAIGGIGEPLLHPQALEILEKFLDVNELNTLILETNGVHLEKIFSLINHINFHKFKLIVNINSISHYEKLHGINALEKIQTQLTQYANLVKKKDEENNSKLIKNQYIQMLKIIDNEKDVDEVFAYIDELGFDFLFQKYNRYIDLMQEKRVSDMTPLERSFCWHLRRDLFILANGDIPFCKQDIQNQNTRGNLFKDGFNKIWQHQKQSWIKNHRQTYPTQPNCQKCDEYFTFNL